MKKRPTVAFLLFIFLWLMFLSYPLSAREGHDQSRLIGLVLDKDGQPIEGVRIELESLIHKLSMMTTADKNGRWAFLYGKIIVNMNFKSRRNLFKNNRGSSAIYYH
ncbi:MAG: carboxypeptidase regulatory-like domain-containing protein [Candidatus Saccharicenans sp.]|nr:carboxypeptidase regulatory-like domain-containing protein [Candidatus Saccharicenans sp.]